MTTHEFKFDQRELQARIDLSLKADPDNNISLSVCGIKEKANGEPEFYLCALAHNAQKQVDTLIDPAIGCPFPPPWNSETGSKVVLHSDLVMQPKFSVSAAALKPLLLQNDHKSPSPDDARMVSAIMGAEVNREGKMETIVTFQMKDVNGDEIANTSLKATQ